MAKKPGIAKKYGYLWITLILFSSSIIGHGTMALKQEIPGWKI
jgi:hypothetical protein